MISIHQSKNALKSPILTKILKYELNKIHNSYFDSLKVSGIMAASIVSRKEMFLINKKHRGKPRSTDILSFPSTSNLIEHQNSVKEQYLNSLIYGKSDPILFGHLIICPDVILKRLSRHCFSGFILISRIRKLLTHGFAHLCNLDHHTFKEFKIMRSFEKSLLKRQYQQKY